MNERQWKQLFIFSATWVAIAFLFLFSPIEPLTSVGIAMFRPIDSFVKVGFIVLRTIELMVLVSVIGVIDAWNVVVPPLGGSVYCIFGDCSSYVKALEIPPIPFNYSGFFSRT
jgi:hypothetical protein